VLDRAVSAVPTYDVSDGWFQLTASREIIGIRIMEGSVPVDGEVVLVYAALTAIQSATPNRYLFAGDDVYRPVQACSYGERARLALALSVGRAAARFWC